MKGASRGSRGPSRRCRTCGRPWWVIVGKVRASGRWLTLIPRVHLTRANARAAMMIERRASSPGSEIITAVAPANSWWRVWPWIWIRIVWIHIREWWQAITLLDRSLAAMKRVFGRDPWDRPAWKPMEPIADSKRKIGEMADDNRVHIDRELTKLAVDHLNRRCEERGSDGNGMDHNT